MPKIERKGNFEGKVTKAAVDGETCLLKLTVETTDGEHGYPSAWLLNKDGTENTETVDYVSAVSKWDKEDTDELCKLLVGKTVKFYSKCKEKDGKEFWNYYLSTKDGGGKPVDAVGARAAWAAAHGKTAPKPAEDLAIKEENIPF